jgi:hydroxyacylglutathione hydrolase
MNIEKLTFNPFQMNTYIVFDNDKNCVIIDPGCFGAAEQEKIISFIETRSLKPTAIVNTHYHIDHVLGNDFIKEKYAIKIKANKEGEKIWSNMGYYSQMLGVDPSGFSAPDEFIDENVLIQVGASTLQVLYTPGHAAGSICLYCKESGFVVTGDVLFDGSIGRTDLPTGDYDVLRDSIFQKLYTLPDETIVYPGHGPSTTIGKEKMSNPFL